MKTSHGIKLILGILPALAALGCGDGRPEDPSVETEFIRVEEEAIPAHEYNSIPERPEAETIIADGNAVKLVFYGAARMVGGACTLVEYRGRRILIDAGLFYQKSLAPLDAQFQFDPSELDWVILTHAHGDHNGRLPLLYRRGYRGKVYGTPATRDISRVMLELGAGIGVPKYRVDFRNRSVHNADCETARELGPYEHLDLKSAAAWYDVMDYQPCPACREMIRGRKKAAGEDVLAWFETANYEERVDLAEGISFRFFGAAHILGSAQVELTLGKGEDAVVIVFTGDLGNRISPILKPPDRLSEADFLVTEATYGSIRKHHREPYFQDFENAVLDAVSRGERVIIPAFVLSKSQKVLAILSELVYENKIPKNCPVIVASPTVAELSRVYDDYLQKEPEVHFSEYLSRRRQWRNPFRNPGIYYGSINSYLKKHGPIPAPAILLVSSGMMDFAAARQMAENYLSDPRTNFFIIGWQSPDSIGRAATVLDEVVIKGKAIPILARLHKFGQFSSHADLTVLEENIAGYRDLKGIVVHHGEAESAVCLAELVNRKHGTPVFVPAFLDRLYLNRSGFLKAAHDSGPEASRLRQLDPALELPPGSAPPAAGVARNNLEMAQRTRAAGNLSLALQYARGAALRAPELSDAHFLAGAIQLEQGDKNAGQRDLRRAIELNPYDFRPYLALASSQIEDRELEEGIENLRTCLFFNPENVQALALLGDVYNALGRTEGMELLKAANLIDPYDREISAVMEKAAEGAKGENPHYIAGETGSYFHYPWCENARRIKYETAIRALERSYFLKIGYRPCPLCHP